MTGWGFLPGFETDFLAYGLRKFEKSSFNFEQFSFDSCESAFALCSQLIPQFLLFIEAFFRFGHLF